MKTEQEFIAQQQIIATTIAMAVLTDRQEWDHCQQQYLPMKSRRTTLL